MRALPWLVFVLATGCGGQVTSGAPDDAGSDAPTTSPTTTPTTTPTTPPTTPPPPPPGAPGATPPARPSTASGGGATVWFAITKFQLGLTRRTTGLTDPSAWKDYGYDLDSRTTTAEDSKTSLNSCKRRAGSMTKVLQDGNEGRDNNFGQHLMAVVKSLKADAEDAVNATVTSGASTILLKLDNVGAADNAKVPGELYLAVDRGSCSGGWAIDTRSLDSMKTAKVKFPNGYMAGGTWVSGALGTESVALPLPWIDAVLTLPLESAVISFKPFSPESGTIAGASSTDALRDAFTPWFKQFGICPGNATYDQVIDTMTQSADLVSGAPYLQDTTRECNALSIGLGFFVEKIAQPVCNTTKPTPPSGGC